MMQKIGIIGLGLIGGSFAKAASAHDCEIFVCDSDDTLQHHFTTFHPAQLNELQLDAILIATPVSETSAIMRGIVDADLQQSILIFDAGSTKGTIRSQALALLSGSPHRFVPCHPIAGTENNGYGAAQPTLFTDKVVLICPEPRLHSEEDLAHVESLWRLLGAIPQRMDIDAHDEIFALVSHLPHILSYCLVNTLNDSALRDILLQYSGSGFRDFTRIASSSPAMWRAICAENRDAILAAIEQFRTQLDRIEADVKTPNHDALDAEFRRAQQYRENWLKSQR